MHIPPLACSAVYPSRLFWCELPNFGDIARREVGLFLNIMELDGTRLVAHTATKTKSSSGLRNEIHTLCCERFNLGTFLSTEHASVNGQKLTKLYLASYC